MFAPHIWLCWALLFVCGLGVLEMLDSFEISGGSPARVAMYIALACAMPLSLVFGSDAALLVSFIILAGSVLTLATRARVDWDDAAAPLYIAYSTIIPAMLLIQIDTVPVCGRLLFFLAFVAPLAGDIIALLVGRSIGRRKLTALSPSKTIEGAIGGLIGSVVGASIIGLIAIYLLNTKDLDWYHYILVGLSGGLFGQLGDLSASLIKRRTGIKDFGALLPGHGGIMDRLDSVLFAAYGVYVFARVLSRGGF